MAQNDKHYMDESDIGSGEKTPGQREVEKDVQSIASSQNGGAPANGQGQPPGRTLTSGNHIARILAVRQPDETYEAQVYVRLAHEPQVAETFIPAGTYGSEEAAWAAAEERATRAFRENEF